MQNTQHFHQSHQEPNESLRCTCDPNLGLGGLCPLCTEEFNAWLDGVEYAITEIEPDSEEALCQG
jgi:hypothetical protein